MDVIYRRCCGLDVHKDSVSACVLLAEPTGRRRKELRRFGTMTRDLLAMLDWLLAWRVTQVAMESTGVYWKPVWNILEGHVEVLLANAQHIKVVPGRKTDTQDCEWIADLLQHGLLRGSFVPPEPIRDLRDLTRYRAILSQETTDVANRIQKVLEDANVKLGSVASDVLGVSGRAMLEAIVEGEQDPTRLAEMARHRLRKKIPELRVALEGRLRDHHRLLLKQLLDHLKFLEGKISEVEQQIERCMAPFEKAVTLWITIPGVDVVTAWSLVAETGARMEQFPSAQHLASWAGLCPGNNESAGKRKSGKTRKGSLWLRRRSASRRILIDRLRDRCRQQNQGENHHQFEEGEISCASRAEMLVFPEHGFIAVVCSYNSGSQTFNCNAPTLAQSARSVAQGAAEDSASCREFPNTPARHQLGTIKVFA